MPFQSGLIISSEAEVQDHHKPLHVLSKYTTMLILCETVICCVRKKYRTCVLVHFSLVHGNTVEMW